MNSHPFPPAAVKDIQHICRKAWQRGLLSGFNGNVSLRLGNQFLLTRSGSAKGYLKTCDFSLVDGEGTLLFGSPASSELGAHLETYRHQPQAMAIVHTHPPKLLALGLIMPIEQRLSMSIFEAEALRSKLAWVPAFEPGTPELSHAVGKAAKSHQAVWLERHGLLVWASQLSDALALSEELEHLAAIQLASRL